VKALGEVRFRNSGGLRVELEIDERRECDVVELVDGQLEHESCDCCRV